MSRLTDSWCRMYLFFMQVMVWRAKRALNLLTLLPDDTITSYRHWAPAGHQAEQDHGQHRFLAWPLCRVSIALRRLLCLLAQSALVTLSHAIYICAYLDSQRFRPYLCIASLGWMYS